MSSVSDAIFFLLSYEILSFINYFFALQSLGLDDGCANAVVGCIVRCARVRALIYTVHDQQSFAWAWKSA